MIISHLRFLELFQVLSSLLVSGLGNLLRSFAQVAVEFLSGGSHPFELRIVFDQLFLLVEVKVEVLGSVWGFTAARADIIIAIALRTMPDSSTDFFLGLALVAYVVCATVAADRSLVVHAVASLVSVSHFKLFEVF